MKEVCSCGAKFDTIEELYAHANREMGLITPLLVRHRGNEDSL
ncbi:hypothetical protein ES703_83966 [subsurface metagenome]